MNPSQNRDRQAPIDLKKKRTGEMEGEVEIAVRKCFGLLHASIRLNVNDVCESLGAEQVADHILRGHADGRVLREADCSGFWRRIGPFGPEPSLNRAVEAAQHPANSKSRRFVCIGTRYGAHRLSERRGWTASISPVPPQTSQR